MTTCNWKGKSGKSYSYDVYEIGQSFNAVDGNYIFAKHQSGGCYPIYIGQGNLQNRANLSKRTDNVTCINKYGATHVHAHAESHKQTRLDEEKDLIDSYQPPCND